MHTLINIVKKNSQLVRSRALAQKTTCRHAYMIFSWPHEFFLTLTWVLVHVIRDRHHLSHYGAHLLNLISLSLASPNFNYLIRFTNHRITFQYMMGSYRRTKQRAYLSRTKKARKWCSTLPVHLVPTWHTKRSYMKEKEEKVCNPIPIARLK